MLFYHNNQVLRNFCNFFFLGFLNKSRWIWSRLVVKISDKKGPIFSPASGVILSRWPYTSKLSLAFEVKNYLLCCPNIFYVCIFIFLSSEITAFFIYSSGMHYISFLHYLPEGTSIWIPRLLSLEKSLIYFVLRPLRFWL